MKRKLSGLIKSNLSTITKKILIIFIIFTLFFTISSLVLSSSSPWPMFRHDPQHTGRSPYKGNEINMFKWNFSVRSNEWMGNIDSSPAIGSDGTIYVLADSYCGPLGVTPCECLWAINPNGTLKWKGKIKVPTYSSPAIGSDGTIYVGSDGTLYAINPNGKLMWKLETEGWIYSSPTIGSDGTIYVGGNDGTLYAINPNGKLKWKFGTGGKVGSSPAISSNGTIYFWSSDGYFYAINPNGTLKWKLGIGGIGSSSPAIGSDGTIYVVNVVNVVRGNDLCAINPNGTLKWKLGIGNIGSSSPAIGSDGTIYIGLGYPLQISLEPSGYLAAINPNGTSKWMLKIEPVDSSPTIGSDGTIYIGSTIYNGWRYLYAINPNGSIVKRFTIEGSFAVPPSHYSSPVIGSDGTIYIGSNDGNLCAISGPVSSPQDSDTTYNEDKIENHKEEVEAKDTGRNFKITDYQAQVKILENGDIKVSEIFTYNFDGNFNGIIRSISTGGSDGLIYFSAFEYSPQKKVLETSQSVEGEMVTFRIYDQSSNERKSFLLEYQLKNVVTKHDDIAEFYWKFIDQNNTSPIENIKVEVGFFKEISKEKINASGFGPLGGKISIQENGKVVYEVGRLSPGEKLGMKILFTNDSSPQISETTYSLTGSLHCPDKRGYPCNSCSSAKGYINHFKGFNVLTTDEDCYVKLTYNNGAYIGNQNNCEVTIKGEKWLGLENESGTELVEEINKGNFDFKPTNQFVARTMNFPEDGYNYEFANNGKEFRLYLSRNLKEAFKAVPWENITVEIKNKETNKVFKYKFQKGIFPQAYSWSNGGVANYGQCVWWTAKRWVEEVDSKTLFPFYPSSPQDVNVIKIDSNYQPRKYDILINYDPKSTIELGHYGFVEKVEGDKVYISQFNWITPGEVYNYVPRTWSGKAVNLFYSNNFYDEYYFKYYYRRMSIEITPIFTDSFEGRVNGNNKLTSSFYQTIFSPNDISFVENGKIGKAVHFNSLSSYIGYPGKYVNPDEGTIRFYFKPDLNFYKFYNLRQSAWKDYSTYKTPFGGFLIDTVAYLPAFTGSFLAFLGFSGDISNKNTNLTFGTWNGSSWSYAKYSNKDDLIFSSGTWYDFAFTWSKREGKTKIFIDGIEKADANFNTSLSSKEPFFIGENPFEYSGTSYWPYGPHSLIGTYDELRVYDEALDFKE